MRINIRSITLAVALALLATGCATTNRGGRLVSSGLVSSQDIANIGGYSYVKFDNLCDRYGIDCSIDSVSKIAVMRQNGATVKVMDRSEISLVNGYTKKFTPETRITDNHVYLSPGLADHILTGIFRKTASSVKTVKPSSQLRIVLDAGHGGKDPGAIGRGGLKEKNITLDIAQRLKDVLDRDSGYDVVMTRNSDVFVPLTTRSYIANNANGDAFISIHVNSARKKAAHGFEVYFLSSAVGKKHKAYDDIAEATELAKCITSAASYRLGLANRGVKPAKFCVLKGTYMPSVLVEVGFISNRKEAINLRSPEYRQSIAESIADGIAAYRRRK